MASATEPRPLRVRALQATAGTWPADWILRRRALHLIRRAGLDRMTEPVRWLDIGSGMGHLLETIASCAPPGSQFVGIDPLWSPPRPVRRRGARAHARWLRGSGPLVPEEVLAAAPFDRVSFFFVLHHVDESTQRSLLQMATQILTNDGQILLLEDTPLTRADRDDTERWDRWMNLEVTPEPHLHRSPDEWRGLFQEVGLELAQETRFESHSRFSRPLRGGTTIHHRLFSLRPA
ncbi:MAG: class I SAM-dependent methyltransferase [Thermoplasmatota archaeon]